MKVKGLIVTEVDGVLFYSETGDPNDWAVIVYKGGVTNIRLHGRTSLKPLEVTELMSAVVQATLEYGRWCAGER